MTQIFRADDIIDTGKISEHFRYEGKLSCDAVLRIIREARNIIRKEPNVLYLKDPMTSMKHCFGQIV